MEDINELFVIHIQYEEMESRSDVQKFLKRLRINLKRDGYKYDSSQLRYMLTSEFGTAEDGTHRPHYHLLFFVSFPISPIDFIRHVLRACYDPFWD